MNLHTVVVVFLHYKLEGRLKKMSRLNNSITPVMVEPEEFNEPSKIEEYVPQHPMLAFHAEQKAQKNTDHLENYVEVQPFATKE